VNSYKGSAKFGGAFIITAMCTKNGLLAKICDVCGSELIGVHCRLRCLNCGYIRDCSDP